VTTDNVVTFLIVALMIFGGSIVSALRRAGRGRTGGQAHTAAPPAATPPTVQTSVLSAGQIERVHAIEAQLARRGITPPPGLQAVIDAFESAAAPAPQPAPPPAAPQPQRQARPHHAQSPLSHMPQRQTVPVARSVDVPVMTVASAGVTVAADLDAATPPSAARRMLATAFGDPAHARNAVVLAEILGPPVALR